MSHTESILQLGGFCGQTRVLTDQELPRPVGRANYLNSWNALLTLDLKISQWRWNRKLVMNFTLQQHKGVKNPLEHQ